MKYLIIINENAKAGKIKKFIPDLVELFNTSLQNIEIHITKDLNEVKKLKTNIDSGIESVIAVGGDGTFNGVINNFFTENRTFGMIPFGTGNDLPLMFGLNKDIKKAVDLIKLNKIKSIDFGKLITEKYEKYFVNAVGIGFDAKVGYTKNKITFINGGLSKYILSLFSSLISYKSSNIQVVLDKNVVLNKKIFLMTIGNGKRTGGGFLLTPDAVIDDGKFDICIVNDIRKSKVIRNFTKVLSGNHLNMEEVEIYHSAEIGIRAEEELYLHFDGETLEKVKNIQIEIYPGKLKVFSF